jgi:putative spermidine/putrescine transport system substrate-binding protein
MMPRRVFGQSRKGSVVVASLGGAWEDAQRVAIFEPFQKETGIELKIVSYMGPSQVRAQQKSGNVEWDMLILSKGALLALHKENMLEKIDYDRIAKEDLAAIRPHSLIHPYGVPTVTFTRGICFNTKYVPMGKHPTSWAAFWDANKFPQPRSLGAFHGSLTPDLEFALLADGVPMDKIYPIDLERALRSLSRIRPHVAKFYTTPAMAPQMLNDGEVAIASSYFNRIGDLMQKGAPVAFEWNQALLLNNLWSILKGAKNYDNAMRLIAYASTPRPQAAFAIQTLTGPTNARAFDFVPADRARLLPSAPDNIGKQLIYDDDFWAEHRADIQRRWDRWILNA